MTLTDETDLDGTITAPVEAEGPREFAIPLDMWPDFIKKIGKMNKRAAKLGCAPVSWTLIERRKVKRTHAWKVDGIEKSRTYEVDANVVTIQGSAPRVGDYEFIAKIEYLSDGASTLFHTVPGHTTKVSERFRHLKPSMCEHCNKVRTRRETFVVHNVVTGEQKQVGRQCLADFTGINTPEAIAAKASWLWSYEDYDREIGAYWGAHFESTIDTHEALMLTSAYIAMGGWVPKSAMSGTPTAALVGRHFFLSGIFSAGERAEMSEARKRVEEGPEHAERAEKVVAWIKNELSHKARSDYELNLVTLVVNDLTQRKHLGIVCSAVSAYQRAMNQKVEYANKHKKLLASEHMGAIGERMRNIEATIERVTVLEAGIWGPRTLLKMITTEGNVLTWFASGDRDWEPGSKVKLTGTVKKHSEFNSVKETMLSRVNMEEVE